MFLPQGHTTAICYRQLIEEEFGKRRKAGVSFHKQLDYRYHRERILNARPKIDSINYSYYQKPRIASYLESELKIMEAFRIMRENLNLFDRLQEIHATKGETDSGPIELPPHRDLASKNMKQTLQTIIENITLLKRIEDTQTQYSHKALLRDYKRLEDDMAQQGKYPLYWRLEMDVLMCEAGGMLRPKVFFVLSEDQQEIGRLEIELRPDVVPRSSVHFAGFVRGSHNNSYVCTLVGQLIPNVLAIMGPMLTEDSGVYVTSEVGRLKHDAPGVVSLMCFDSYVQSQFVVAFKPLPILDYSNVVVGKVTSGLHLLQQKKASNYWISGSGIVNPTIGWPE